MDFAFNVPINSVSFGQVSTCLLREAYRRKLDFPIFPIGSGVDLSSQEDDEGFFDWEKRNYASSERKHSRSSPTFKLWHLKDSLSSMSERQLLLSFYELDSPTQAEINILKNQAKVLVSSNFTKEVFESHGVDNVFSVPLGFDKHNFSTTDKTYAPEGRVTFTLCGKFEKRKHHAKILKAWAKKYGNNKDYFLNCALYNHFLSPEQNNAQIAQALENEKYFNINFVGYMDKNELYNDFLNAGDIVIGMSGGEGWGLPEFHSVGLGKHAVILNANAYKEWASTRNSVMVEPSGKIPAADGHFFHQGGLFNQGEIYDWKEDDFLSACEVAISRVQSNKVNRNGLELQEEFTIEKSFDAITNHLKD